MTVDDILGIIIIGLLVGSLLADFVFGVTWNKAYFTSGLPIFVKQIPVNRGHTNLPSRTLLEKQFHSDVIPSLIFKEMDLCSYGIRDKILQSKWIRTPNLMHGLLIFDSNTSQVIVRGFTNWFALVFSLIWLGLPISGIVSILFSEEPLSLLLIPIGVIGAFILIMGMMYLFQSSRFSSVASFAAQSWARKYVRESHEA